MDDHDNRNRNRDMVLHPNEFAHVLDKTKGNVKVYVGPDQTSMAQTDQPVRFDEETKRFVAATLEQATQRFATAPEGWYVTLKNPAKNEDQPHPKVGTSSDLVELDIGRKVNVQGPCSFALWPGQMVRVLQGHHLRSNQYLVARVYDDEAARKNWSNAVIKTTTDTESGDSTEDVKTEATKAEIPDLTMGQLLVIKGTDVSFYIPPTGVAVVPDKDGEYVRDAVTLETLDYCILLNENGNKRYVRGPDVVFPEPTEVFADRGGSRKFKAIELNHLQGIYIKVTAPYAEMVNGKEVTHKEGDELFITGKDQMIYFPRPEHAIIKREGQGLKHYAIAIPEGEARYVLNRETGAVDLVKGHTMFLPDPRKQVIVHRVLSKSLVDLLYPGNQEAQKHNANLRAVLGETPDVVLTSGSVRGGKRKLKSSARNPHGMSLDAFTVSNAMSASSTTFGTDWADEAAGDMLADEFERGSTYTKPPSITIDSKYEGAVAVNVWTGYAMLLVRKNGDRRVVMGPKTVLLEYDEVPEVLTLSTGKPKTTDNLLKTVYLRTKNNKISDIINVETKDLCRVAIKVSYRVNFDVDGDLEHMFDAENYVKILSDHIRSLVRNEAKNYGVEEFYRNVIPIVRDIVLGKTGESGKRTGRVFDENGMTIYDVEVLGAKIGDDRIADLLSGAQHAVVAQTLKLQEAQLSESLAKEKEEIERRLAQTRSETTQMKIELEAAEESKKLQQRKSALTTMQEILELERAAEEAAVARDSTRHNHEMTVEKDKLSIVTDEIMARTEAYVKRAGAVSDDLVAALQTVGDKLTLAKITEGMAPMAYIGGESIADVLQRVLSGSNVVDAFVRGRKKNGRKGIDVTTSADSPIGKGSRSEGFSD